MPTKDIIKKWLDAEDYQPIEDTTNKKAEWELYVSQHMRTTITIRIAKALNADTVKTFFSMDLADDVQDAIRENDLDNSLMNELSIETLQKEYVTAKITPNVKTPRKMSVSATLYGEFTKQDFFDRFDSVRDAVLLIFIILRKHVSTFSYEQ